MYNLNAKLHLICSNGLSYIQLFRMDLKPAEDTPVNNITSAVLYSGSTLIGVNGSCTVFNILLVAAAEFVSLVAASFPNCVE